MKRKLTILFITLLALLLGSCQDELVKVEYKYHCEITGVDEFREGERDSLLVALDEQGLLVGDQTIQYVSGEGRYVETATSQADNKAVVQYNVWRNSIITDSLPLATGKSFFYTLIRLNQINAETSREVIVVNAEYKKSEVKE